MIIVCMGVAGSGKSTVGKLLAQRMGWLFVEADELHPPANKEKMAQGLPLTEEDREPWLASLQASIKQLYQEGRSAVIACSALKSRYRKRLRGNRSGVVFVYLQGDPAVVRERLQGRSGHFFKSDLLGSQYAELEEPDDALVVDTRPSPGEIVSFVVNTLGLHPEK